MRGFTLILIASAFVPLSTLAAQQPPLLEPGTPVRVTAPDCGLEMQTLTVAALRGETLVFDATECRLGSSHPFGLIRSWNGG